MTILAHFAAIGVADTRSFRLAEAPDYVNQSSLIGDFNKYNILAAGTSLRAPSRARAGGAIATRCSLAIRQLANDTLSLGPPAGGFDPRSASADWGSFFYIKISSDILSLEIMRYAAVTASRYRTQYPCIESICG